MQVFCNTILVIFLIIIFLYFILYFFHIIRLDWSVRSLDSYKVESVCSFLGIIKLISLIYVNFYRILFFLFVNLKLISFDKMEHHLPLRKHCTQFLKYPTPPPPPAYRRPLFSFFKCKYWFDKPYFPYITMR